MIPIFIITNNRLEVLKKSIQSYYDCIKTPFEIVIIDFGTSYELTLEYLKHLENKKIKVYWNEKISYKGDINKIRSIVQDYFKTHPRSNYVVTDPDIALDNVEGDILDVYAHLLEELPHIIVAGPMLRIDDLPDYYPKKEDVIAWEMQHNPPRKGIYNIRYKDKIINLIFAKIDTTFGMRRAGQDWWRFKNGARVLAPYAARHLDWYLDPKNLTEDQKYYRRHASRRIATWNHWSKEARNRK